MPLSPQDKITGSQPTQTTHMVLRLTPGQGAGTSAAPASDDYGTQFEKLDQAEAALQEILRNFPKHPNAAALRAALENIEASREILMHKMEVFLDNNNITNDEFLTVMKDMLSRMELKPDDYPPGIIDKLRTLIENATPEQSLADIWMGIINDDKNDYVGAHTSAMQKLVELGEDVGSFVTKLGESVLKNKEGETGTVTINAQALDKKLWEIVYKYTQIENALYKSKLTGPAGLEEVKKIAKEFGMDDTFDPGRPDARNSHQIQEKKNPDGTVSYYLTPNLKPLLNMDHFIREHNAEDKTSVVWSQIQYQGFDNIITTGKEQLKNDMQIHAEKLGRANTKHDNLIKLYSSLMDAFYSMLKSFLT